MTPELLAMLTPDEAKAWALCEEASPAPRWDRSWDEQPYSRDGYKRSKFAIGPQYGVPAHPNTPGDKERGDDVAAKVYADAAWMQNARTSLPLALTTIATLRADYAEIRARYGRAWEALCTIGDAVDKAGHYTLIPERALHVGSAVNALIAEAEELRAELRTVADLIQEVGVLGIASTMDAVVVSGQPSARDLLTWAAKAMDAWPKERQALRDRLVMAEEREREMVTARDILRETLAEQQRAFVIGLDLAQRTADAEIAELRATLDNERGEGSGPSEKWTWLDGAWRILDDVGGCTMSVHPFDNGRWHWRQHDPPYGRSKFPFTSARSAMRAADDAVKGAT